MTPAPTTAKPTPSSTTAFGLQGGRRLRASLVGMVRALTPAGSTLDLGVGSSAGALNGAVFAAAPSAESIDRTETLRLSLERRHVAPISPGTLIRAAVSQGKAAISSAAPRKLLRTRADVSRLQDIAVPMHVVAPDVDTGTVVVPSRGTAVSALLASSAFPTVRPHVRVGERHLTDGGVTAKTPSLQAEAATTLCVPPAPVTKQTARQAHATLLAGCRAVGQILDERERRNPAAVRSPVFPPAATPQTNLTDFRDTPQPVEAGYWLLQHFAAMA
ncbi:patatin-like phospholipase family protein [Streptomyces sp. NPDC008238]